MRAVIVANGRLSHPADDRARVHPDDWIVAADGGLHNCRVLGLSPAVLVGDLDSVDPAALPALQASGAVIVQHPQRKDETDLELALAYAVAHGAREILVLGALGDRWDQTLANALLLASPTLKGIPTWLADGRQRVTVARPGVALVVSGTPGDTVSLLPLAGNALGVTTTGLEYPLIRENLLFSATRGVSNRLLGESATIELTAGLLLTVHAQPDELREEEHRCDEPS